MKRHLSIILRGGLGNQLFQLLTCVSLAKNADFVPSVVVDSFTHDKYGRRLEVQPLLDLFNVTILTQKDISSFAYLHESILASPLFFSSSHNPLSNTRVWSSNYLLDGYFLDVNYFDSTIVQIFRNYLSANFLVESFPSNYSFIHIRERHGQTNISQPSIINSLPFDYYSSAIDSLLDCDQLLSKSQNILIFSDLFSNPSKSNLLPRIVEKLSIH